MNEMARIITCTTDHEKRVVRLEMAIDRGALSLTETPFGTIVDLPGATAAGVPGAPALPRLAVKVACPAGTWPEPLRVGAIKRTAVTREPRLVVPVQPLRPAVPPADERPGDGDGERNREERRREWCCDETEPTRPRPDEELGIAESLPERVVVPPDPALYEAAAADDRVARITGIRQVGLAPIVDLEIRPIQLTAKGTLAIVASAEIELPFGPRPSEPVPPDRLREILREAGADVEAIDVERLSPLPEPTITSRAQAGRLADLARSIVVNPDVIGEWGVFLPELDLPAEWLAITDNQRWDADTISPAGPLTGDMVAEFQRLAAHKRSRGLSARVVTITDIVAGRYGDFRTGSRDLPEVIRRFLKSVHQRWGVAWLLIGGDVGVVPPRRTATALEGHIDTASDNPPKDNASFWTGSFLKMNVVSAGIWWPGGWPHVLVNPATGRPIPYDSTGASDSGGLGWYYTTSNSYATRTTMRTQWVRVNGPAAVVDAKLQWLYEWNQVPTDFYYSSLQSWVIGWNDWNIWLATVRIPYVYEPAHDWDALDNGLYGQYVGGEDVDGVHWQTDLSVGRAPVQSASEATTFVDKVIAYERYAQRFRPSGSSWTRRVFIGASNWGGSTRVTPTSTNPPEANRFRAGSDVTVVHLKDVPGDFDRQLIAEISNADRRELPWNTSTAPGARGWYYARSATDHALQTQTISILGTTFTFPLPSAWIVVRGPAAERNPASYLLDHESPDGSMVDQEQLRTQLAAELPQWNRVTRLYEDLTDLTPAQVAATPIDYLTSARVEAALNGAPHIVSLSGHGSGNGCCGASSAMAQGLTNGGLAFIAYADSCLTNQIDAEDAFSEELLQNPDGGAVAYVGNTRFSWIGVGDDMQRAFFHRLTTTRHLGLLNDSRVVAMNYGYWQAYARWITFALTLTGDPEMPVWRHEPAPTMVDIRWKGDLRVPIEVVLPKPVPDPPPWFAIQVSQDHLERTIRARAGETVRIEVADFEAGPLTLSVAPTDVRLELRPAVRELQAAGPIWLAGSITTISHRHDGGEATEITLATGHGVRRLRVPRSDGDHDVLVNAAVEAHLAGATIALLANVDADGAEIHRFRFREVTPGPD
jgi:hypothetical protein